MEYFLIKDIFNKKDFRWLQRICKELDNFKEISLGDTSMFAKEIPYSYNQVLNESLQQATSKRYLDISSFVRLNSSDRDYSVRIHSDSKINDCIPDTACVFYLDTIDNSGTALFEHPSYGRVADSHAIYKNETNWNAYYKCNSLANSMFVYPSNYFHGRFPWKSSTNRIVIVKFLKTLS